MWYVNSALKEHGLFEVFRHSIIYISSGGPIVNWDQVKGNWKQFKGKVQEKWGELTDDELDQIEGNREQLVGKVQERYGIAKEEAERQVEDFERNW